MERIIEFPLDHKSVFDGKLDALPGYSICYQYDVTHHGFGPYGFTTPQAKTLVESVFDSLVYWDSGRERLYEVAFPYWAGIYFLKGQARVDELGRELSTYRQKILMGALRAKRGKDELPAESNSEPLLLRIFKGRELQPEVILELLDNFYEFVIVHSYNTEAGKTFIFFDASIRERIKIFSKTNNIDYAVYNSIDELTSW